MITEEQIKNLKSGDTIYLNNYPLTFQTSNIHGHVFAHDDVAECGEGCACWFSNKYLSLTSAETAPKYDPCRLFRKGDIVEPCQVNGRWSSPVWEDRSGIHYEVTKDEDPLTAHMEVKDPDSPQPFLVHAAFFKLVTPVEELEPYTVDECGFAPTLYVRKNGKVYMTIPYKEGSSLFQTREEALAAAEAQRDRLNAEYRKEQK